MVRGEVFRLRVPRGTGRSEQRGARYAVVVQADELLALSTVLVSPTSRSAPPRSFRPTVELAGTPTRVLVEQTTAITGSGGRRPCWTPPGVAPSRDASAAGSSTLPR